MSLRAICIVVSILGITVLGSACSGQQTTTVDPLSKSRSLPPGTRQIKKSISRKEYWQAIEKGGDINRARLVEVFHRDRDPGVRPEYRLFDIREGSVYDLIGLKPLDILISANDYSVPSGSHFWQYLQLLRFANDATVEINRDGRPMVFNYSFVNDLPQEVIEEYSQSEE